jgi:rubredoxin
MSKLKLEWKCRLCGDFRYVTIQSEYDTSQKKWKSKYYACRGCGVMFHNPYTFNLLRKEKGDAGKEEII